MLNNNRKMIIGRNFLFSLCIIVLMFTAVGFSVENSYAVDLNDTFDEIRLESDDMNKLENSQENEILEVNTQDSQEILSQQIEVEGNSYSNIRSKISSASPGSEIILKNTYISDGNPIIIDKQLTITGQSSATLNGNHKSIAFVVKAGAAGTVFNNIKFINGKGNCGSAVSISAKNVKVLNCIFEDNRANYRGAITTDYDLYNASGLIVDNCQFKRNSAYFDDLDKSSSGPALSMFGTNSEVKNSLFESNWVKSNVGCFGGAIQVGLDKPGSNAKVTGCTFKNNYVKSATDCHGGAGCVRDGTVYSNCIFINNSADEGGALTFHASGEIKNCTFIDNVARKYGGALSTGFLFERMDLKIIDCDFYGNSAPMGGAVQAKGINILIDDSNFKNNHVTERGGAIYIEAEDVSIKDSNFNSNEANINGGAIFINGKDTSIKNSSFIANKAIPHANKLNDGLGGAIYVNSYLAFIKDNSFRLNTARNGSAIYYDESGEKLILENNELFQNQAWVYQLPISANNIYYGDNEEIKVTLIGGNNIANYGDLGISNAIYNAADTSNIIIDNESPVNGATNTGVLYQDDREYNIKVSLKVQHEDGTVVYDGLGYTSYLGEIIVNLNNLKAGKYFVSAQHLEDTYYKGITNATTFIVTSKVDNEVIKTVSKEVGNYEDVIKWTIAIKNHGPSNSTNVTLYDVLPEGAEWINDTANGRYDHKNGKLSLDNLNVGETFTFDIITVIKKTGTLVNRANVTSAEFDSNMTNNFDEKSIFINPSSDLAVVKQVSKTHPNYKDHINWTITISNRGPDVAHNVIMFDMLPKSMIFVSSDRNYNKTTGKWEIGVLDVDESVTINIECIVNETGFFENFVSVNATEFDYDMTNNNDTRWIFVSPASDLAIVKTVNSSNANFNDFVKWTLVITNNGPDNATNVKVLDLLPEGFTYINSTLGNGDVIIIDSLEVGKTVSIDIITLVETTGKYINLANVSSDNYDFNLTNNEDEEEIYINPACDLSVTKSVSETDPKFNDVITWTIEIINNGPDVAHNVTMTDLLPKSLIWIEDDSMMDYDPLTGILFLEELDVDESYVLNIECRVNGTGLICNNVSVVASEYDYNLTNNFDNETIDVEKSADVSVIKSVNNSNPNYNDFVVWKLVISNKGPDKATNVYVKDALPEGLVLVNYTATKGIYYDGVWKMCCLENGEVQTIEILSKVNKTGEIINIASIRADEHDSNESNNIDNESIDVPLAVDLQVVIEVNNTSPVFGEAVNWNIVVTNNGPDNATGVVLKDILPDELIFVGYKSSKGIFGKNLWDIGSLNVGEQESLDIITISNDLGKIYNDADVNSTEYDWNMSNNHDQALIDVRPIADLSIEKFVDKSQPKYGETIKWTLIVFNNGPNIAHNVVVEDVLPEGLKFISSNGDYSKNIWKIESLKVGEKKSLEILCKVTSTGDIINVANVRADELDLDESNNHAEENINVPPASDLSITKIASKYRYRVGDVIEYMIEVVNNGPDTARNIKITEILDDLLKIKSFKTSKGSFNKFAKVWTIKSLDYGESARLFIKVVALGSGIIKNAVQVESDTYDPDKSNNHDYAVVNVTENPLNDVPNRSMNVLNEKTSSVLQLHPTANPIVVLMLSLLFSIIFLGSNISKKQ